LTEFEPVSYANDTDDCVVFTIGANGLTKSDPFGQRYQTPESAVRWGADFIIAGRANYAAENSVEESKDISRRGVESLQARTTSIGTSLTYRACPCIESQIVTLDVARKHDPQKRKYRHETVNLSGVTES